MYSLDETELRQNIQVAFSWQYGSMALSDGRACKKYFFVSSEKIAGVRELGGKQSCGSQNVLYSIVIMVYFKQKHRTCKSDPYKVEKSRIESNIKVGIGK